VLGAIVGLSSCTENSKVSLQVLRDKVENQLVAAAGEGEVAIELYRQQYATLKERLVKLKTLHAVLSDQLEYAYTGDDKRKILLYESKLKNLSEKIPVAENTLKEFYNIVQRERNEIKYLKDELSVHQALGSLSDSLSLTSEAEKRASNIKQLTLALKEKAKRAESILNVNEFESNF